MSNALSTTQQAITTTMDTTQASTMFTALVLNSDLSKLTEAQRVDYYKLVCERVGLDPYTKPFDMITLQGKLTLYANKAATAQLTAVNRLKVEIVSREVLGGLYVATVRATKPDGSSSEDIGAVSITGLQGEAAANAMLKAITKAKRRAVLSVCGLGMMDETETESIPAHQVEAAEVPREAVTAPLTDSEADTVQTWIDTIESADDGETLTEIVKQLKNAPARVADATKPTLTARSKALALVWKGGQYVSI